MSYSRAQQNEQPVVYAHIALAKIALAQGDLAEARRHADAAMKVLEKAKRPAVGAQTRLLIAMIDIADGHPDHAEKTLNEVLTDPAAGLLDLERAELDCGRALALIELGRAHEAVDLAAEASKSLATTDSVPLLLLVGRVHALASGLDGDAAARSRALKELLDLRRRADDGGYVVASFELRLAATRIVLLGGDSSRAIRDANEIAVQAGRLGLGSIVNRAHALTAARSDKPR